MKMDLTLTTSSSMSSSAPLCLPRISYTQGSDFITWGMDQFYNSPLTLNSISYSASSLGLLYKIWKQVENSEIYISRNKVKQFKCKLKKCYSQRLWLTAQIFFPESNFKTQLHFTILCVQSKPIFLYLYSHTHFAYNLLFCL